MAVTLASDESGKHSRPFAVQHPFDRNFVALFIIVCWLGVIMGFTPAVTKRFTGQADYPASWVLQVHVFAFTGWLLLLTLQATLIRIRRVALHRTFGLIGVLLIPIMATTGILSEVLSQRYYFDHSRNGLAFFIVPIGNIVGFTLLASAALGCRKSSNAHKRLMLMANIVIVGAAFSRWWGEGLARAVGDDFWGMIVNTYAGTNLLLAGVVIYDLFTRKVIHPVYLFGLPALLLGEVVVSWIYHSPDWPPVAQVLIGR